MRNNDTLNKPSGDKKSQAQSDELYQANGVVYIEASLKINHLRIIMAIIKHLQQTIRSKVSYTGKALKLPVQPVPDSFEIPVADFHIGTSNGMRLRSCLE